MASDTDMRGFVPEPSGRGTIGILLSCVSTLIICIWTSVHPDVPASFSKKVTLAFMMLTAPEVILAFAIADYLEARGIAQEINAEFPACAWTTMDAYFEIMDGFVFDGRVVRHFEILDLMLEGEIDLVRSDSLGISDRSKADGIAKLIACVQIVWLMLQCLARAIEHMPISTLELGTVGYAFVAILIYGLQWQKPKDVRMPVVLQPRGSSRRRTSRRRTARAPETSQSTRSLSEDNAANGGQRGEHHRLQQHGPRAEEGRDSTSRRSNDDRRWDGSDSGSDSASRTSKAAFLQFGIEHRDQIRNFSVAVTCLIFGGWHCVAWDFAFPSVAELWIWRVCSIVTMVPGVVITIWLVRGHPEAGVVKRLMSVNYAVYALSREAIVVLMFIGLRRLPAGVFDTVKWTTFLPHF
ncbi:hypothetical protein DENSPDRAFT_278761 [Dentipellis sp. KUC8613]|nr:hypothetical protein DENSPDRAFT_278761 [Dentipellis sp. KUC8613]